MPVLYSLKLNEKLKQLKSEPVEMKKLDTNNYGIISVEEWEQAVKSIQAEMVEQELKNSKIKNESDILICRGEEDKKDVDLAMKLPQ